jgi:hypothetical protein
VATTANIQIKVDGLAKLQKFREQLWESNKLLKAIKEDNLNTFNKLTGTLGELSRSVQIAAENLQNVKLGTKAAKDEVANYVTALGQFNTAQAQQNALIENEIQLRLESARVARLQARGIQEVSNAYAFPIGPGPASPVDALVGQSSPVAGRVQRIKDIKDDQFILDKALLDLERKSAAELNKKVQLQQDLVEGTREVLELVAETQRKQRFLAGKSGSTQLGPLLGPGGAGFPVALPLTAVEQKGVEAAAKKLQILQRTAQTRKDLAGLAANLQRLETRTTVAIADAGREQQELNDKKQRALQISERELEIAKQGALIAGRFSPIGGDRNIKGSPAFLQAQRARRREALGNAIIGGAFPLLFGQGIGGAVGGGLGGFAGGLAGGQFGLGLSLVGTALGSQFDTLAQKASDLGKALNPLTADLSLLVESAGLAGTRTGTLITSLEEYAGAQEAQKAAADQLAVIIGQDGVDALTDLGNATTRLGNEAAEAFTALSAALAPALASIANFLAGQIERSRVISTVATTTAKGVVVRDAFRDDKNVTEAIDKFNQFRITEVELQKVLLDAGRKREQTEKAAADARLRGVKGSELENKIARINQTILENKGDLTNKAVENAKREILTIQKSGELLKVYNNQKLTAAEKDRRINLINQEFKNNELKLTNDVNKAIERKNKTEKSGNKEAKEAARLAKAVAQETLKQDKLEQKISVIGTDKLTKVQAELASLENREALERGFIILSTEDVRLQEAKLKTLSLQFDLKEAQLKQTEKELTLQRQLKDITRGQELANLRRGLEQELESGQLPTGDPFRDPFIALEREQRFRRADVFAGLDQQRDRLKIQRSIPGVDTGEIDKQLKNIEDQRAAYESLLPSIEANQRAQLLYNQALSQVEGPVNALVGGLQDIVAGTKTAQEVFADFLKTIADQLIQTAATMIAQYIAIGIAKAFAFGGGGGGFSGANSGLPTFGDYSGINLGGFGAFAEGGYVTGPTNALIGEGGEPEYVIPRSKMRESMARYSRGARGSSVIPSQAGGGDSEMSGGTAVAAPIDVRYTVERINSVDYVTADQFQLGMQRAAQQGAAEGERRTLRSLKNSPGTRRGVGM